MQTSQRRAPSPPGRQVRPLEPVQILSRVLAVLLAVVPLTLVLTAAALRPLDESGDRDERAVRPWAGAETPGTRAPRAPGEGLFAED